MGNSRVQGNESAEKQTKIAYKTNYNMNNIISNKIEQLHVPATTNFIQEEQTETLTQDLENTGTMLYTQKVNLNSLTTS